MSNTNETLADIVAEMRNRFAPYAKSQSNDARYVAYLGYKEFADRIEAACEREIKALKESVLDFCNAFTLVYPPNDGDCPVVLAGAFELLKDAMGIETVKIRKGENDGSK